MTEPVDPFERGVFDSLEAAPWATPMDDLGLVKAIDRLRQGVVVAVAEGGVPGWLCVIAALGVIVSGLRDLAAAQRCARLVPAAAAPLAAALPGQQTVLISGGTGFIGSRLLAALAGAGHEVILLTRDPARAAEFGPIAQTGRLRVVTTLDAIAKEEPIHAIVNLAGEPIADRPWTTAKRHRIVRSRLAATYALLRLIRRLEHKPTVLINGSAIGVYGLRDDRPLDETSLGTPCFSRRVCVGWERAAVRAEALGVRTIMLRTGLVLAAEGGMLARMLAPFEFGLGGRFGDGRQWLSWIHRDDLVRLIVHGIATPNLRGPLNGTAPEPVTNRAFTVALGRALGRPAILPVPAWPLRLALGAFAEELLLSGQRIVPAAALRSGFRFTYPDVDKALNAITGRLQPVRADTGMAVATLRTRRA